MKTVPRMNQVTEHHLIERDDKSGTYTVDQTFVPTATSLNEVIEWLRKPASKAPSGVPTLGKHLELPMEYPRVQYDLY